MDFTPSRRAVSSHAQIRALFSLLQFRVMGSAPLTLDRPWIGAANQGGDFFFANDPDQTAILDAMAKDRLMAKEIGSSKPTGAAYRKEAARLRELAAEATTDLARRILEDQARAQDRLAAGQAE